MTDIGKDARAFEEAYAEYRKPVESLVRAMLCGCPSTGKDTVEDLVQDVFVKAFAAYVRLRDEAKLRQWLYQIARNVCREKLASIRRDGRLLVAEEFADAIEAYCAEDLAASPVSQLERSTLRMDLSAALAGIPVEFRVALYLHYVCGMSVCQVAAATGASLATAKWRIHRGLRICRLRLMSERSRNI